jgi:hypothetical protein
MHLQRREQLATHLLYHKTNKSLRWDSGASPLGAIGVDVGAVIKKAIAKVLDSIT